MKASRNKPNSSAEIQKGIAYQQFVTDFPSYPAGSIADIGALPVKRATTRSPAQSASGLPTRCRAGTDPGIVASMHASRAMPHDPR